MTYLLDTCLISELVAKQPNQKVLDWVDAQIPETLYLSVITIGEIARGIYKLTPSKRVFEKSQSILTLATRSGGYTDKTHSNSR
jgi:predicted nucleic acid-binding protein